MGTASTLIGLLPTYAMTLGCRGACVQISEEGPDTISNWGHIARFLRYPCRQVGDRVKNSAPPQEKWSCPGNSGGSIHVNQESGVCPQAHGAQSRRQRFKISPHPHRVAYPSPRALLSDHAQASCGLEVILEVLVVHL